MGIELSPLVGRLLFAGVGLLLFGFFGWLAILPRLGLKTQMRPRGAGEIRYVSEAEYRQQMAVSAHLSMLRIQSEMSQADKDASDRIFGRHLHWSVLACLGSAAALSASMLYGNLIPAESYAWLATFRSLVPLVLLTALGTLELWGSAWYSAYRASFERKVEYSDAREAKRELVKFKLSLLAVTFTCGAINTALALLVGWLFY
jgi:hypothetical protein